MKGEGYNQALEHVRFIYNRLYVQGNLCDRCSQCPVMEEVSKILAISTELKIEEIENELGYYAG